ncbi:MG296/MPN423 family protein [Mycoplasmoides genitalium]|uniref:MG296/MPN423 family protein n=1 Tax=Mycoplasmoides genitalium TaxID=2097 RepID=UPI004055444E
MKPQLIAFKKFLQTEFQAIDFETFRINFNLCLKREQDNIVIYEDDDYDDQPFFFKPMLSDGFFIQTEVIKQLDYLAKVVENPKDSDQQCCQNFYEALIVFISALAITKGINPNRFHQRLVNKFAIHAVY